MEPARKAYIDAAFVIIIWSGFVLVSRAGGRGVLSAYDVTALRFGVAALVLLPLWVLRNRMNLLQWRMLALAVTGGIGYAVLAYLGFKHAPAAHAAILLPGMLPFEIAFFSWLLRRERPSARRVAGLVTLALGVACLGVESFRQDSLAWEGDLAFVGASSFWALYTVLARAWGVNAWDATIAVALLSAAFYLPVYWAFLPSHLSAAPWGMIALQAFYQGVLAVIVAMVLYMRAVNVLGASKVGVCMALVPAVSGVLAVPLLGEPLGVPVMLGLVLTSAGAWIGNSG